MTRVKTPSQPVAPTLPARHIPILNAPHEDVMFGHDAPAFEIARKSAILCKSCVRATMDLTY